MREDLRILITRWRMSCFDLAIETGRYERTQHDERVCLFCGVIEDEQHVIYHCQAYNTIRNDYRDLLEKCPTVKEILNPQNRETAEEVGMLLKLIEKKRHSLI